jgi:putative FmdB family regulatory protein
MPIYDYEPTEQACEKCQNGFQDLQSLHELPLTVCPHCQNSVKRVPSLISIGRDRGFQLSPKAKSAYQTVPLAANETPQSSIGHDHDCAALGCFQRAHNLKKKYSFI